MIHRLTIICFTIILVHVLSKNDHVDGDRARREGIGGGALCSGEACANSDSMLLIIVLGIVFSLIFISGCVCLTIYMCNACCGKKRASNNNSNLLNEEYIQTNKQAENEFIISMDNHIMFETGQWCIRYDQYGKWHGPFYLKIHFNIGQNTLYGSGKDDMGQFTLIGNISEEFLTIDMTKHYRSGTGDSRKKLGHETKIHLKWNNERCAFLGTWSIHTYKYQGEGLYELIKIS